MNDQILELSNDELEAVAGGAPATLTDFKTAEASLKTISFVTQLNNNALGSQDLTAASVEDAKSKAQEGFSVSLP